jgi:PKD repeat protein
MIKSRKDILFVLMILAYSIFICSCSKDDGVSSPPKPKASFSMDKSTAEIGEEVLFTNHSENASTYIWDFGDGTTDLSIDANHFYSEAAIFSVKLKAMGEGGIDSTSKDIEITLPPFNIVPGERIGDFILGDNIETHFSKISETYLYHFFIKLTSGEYIHLLEFKDTGIGFFVINFSASVFDSDIPTEIYAFDPFECNTEKGITFGSTLAEVETLYGTPDKIGTYGAYYYDTIGLYFSADDTRTVVDGIHIYEPTQAAAGISLKAFEIKKFHQLQAKDKVNHISKDELIQKK